jgi:hypothetical protein
VNESEITNQSVELIAAGSGFIFFMATAFHGEVSSLPPAAAQLILVRSMTRHVAMALIPLLLAFSGCHPTVAVGLFRAPRESNITMRANSSLPEAVDIVTDQGNRVLAYARPKQDREVASDLDIPAAIMGFTRLIPKEGVPWVRAYSHRRRDGAQLGQIDYCRVTESSEIHPAEVVSINRFIIFRDNVVVVRGLLTKGDLERDYSALDHFLERLAIQE